MTKSFAVDSSRGLRAASAACLALAFLLCAAPLWAQENPAQEEDPLAGPLEALTPPEREAVRSNGPWRTLGEAEIREALSGKTLHYLLMGRPRGEEHHFEDGRVVWRLPDGECLSGVWGVKNQTLCYIYGWGRTGCWTMIEGPQGYRHRPLDGEPPDVVVRRVSEEPVECHPTPTS